MSLKIMNDCCRHVEKDVHLNENCVEENLLLRGCQGRLFQRIKFHKQNKLILIITQTDNYMNRTLNDSSKIKRHL